VAIIGIILSFVIGVLTSWKIWKPKPDTKLFFSYFCGTGQHQRKLIYKEAHKRLRDRTWGRIGIAVYAYKLGNFTHDSKILVFACTLLYLPLAILGFIEMFFRIFIGTVVLLAVSLAHRLILFVLRLISYLLIPLWRVVDSSLRVKQYCPHCYLQFDMPKFICPSCQCEHEALLPGRSGIFIARCECSKMLRSAALTGRSRYEAQCPGSNCSGELAASNAKQFTIQLIGGNTSGKTAYIAALSNEYIKNNSGENNFSIKGLPEDKFRELDKMFKNGATISSSAESITTYNLVHSVKKQAKHNLIICDIPDELVLSGVYEKSPLNLRFSNGIVILVDPLCVASVREECLKTSNRSAVDSHSQDDINTIIVEFIHQFSKIAGLSSGKMLSLPVAVLISKADLTVIKRNVGIPKIKSMFNSAPDKYGNDLEKARDTICREYLLSLGLGNCLNNLESVFSNVNYFAVSAIGHNGEMGALFEPVGVIKPLIWLAKIGKAGFRTAVKN